MGIGSWNGVRGLDSGMEYEDWELAKHERELMQNMRIDERRFMGNLVVNLCLK